MPASSTRGSTGSSARPMRGSSARRYRRSMGILGGLSNAAAKSPAGRFDVLLSAVVGVVLIASTWAGDAEPWPKGIGIALSSGVGAALWGRRRAPVATGVVISGLVALYQFIVRLTGTALIAPLLIAFYSIGAYAGWRGAIVGFGLAYAGTVLGLFADPNVRNVLENALFVLFIAGAVWASGISVRTSRARSAKLADLTAQLQRERDEKARLAVAAERGRIARELHDVVAHGISVIAVQAGAGRHALGSDPHRAHAAFAAIEDTARQVLVEMRHMLGLLRERGESTTPAPLPRLADCDKLIEQARADGLVVDIVIEGEQRPLPPGIDLGAYRILQEALTNVRKHAPAARAEVQIRYAPAAVEIEVRNDRAPTQGSSGGTTAGGHGLIGMRERVALYGGTLEAGPLAEGGFRVRVRIPVDQDRP